MHGLMAAPPTNAKCHAGRANEALASSQLRRTNNRQPRQTRRTTTTTTTTWCSQPQLPPLPPHPYRHSRDSRHHHHQLQSSSWLPSLLITQARRYWVERFQDPVMAIVDMAQMTWQKTSGSPTFLQITWNTCTPKTTCHFCQQRHSNWVWS